MLINRIRVGLCWDHLGLCLIVPIVPVLSVLSGAIMATVFRVKRRNVQEPQEALVLACKRRKQTEDKDEETDRFSAVIKFATTVKVQENDLSILLPINEREDVWKSRLHHKVDISKKLRLERKQHSTMNRFKIVNCFRHADLEVSNNPQCDNKNVIIYDIESSEQEMENNGEDASSHKEQYVYDIYYGQTNNECDFTSLDHIVDIMPISSFDFGSADGASDDDSSGAEDDDDSNDENNWRNDYPDSDHSVNEGDMRLAMKMGNVNLGNELSSSDEMIYGVESDPQDVEFYGEEYAKYKARIQKEFNVDDTSGDENSESSDENVDSGDEKGYCVDNISADEEIEDPFSRYM